MKKLLILIPLFIFSCIDSELSIPSENVGDIDDINTEDPVENKILESYTSNYPNAKFEITADKEGNINIFEDKALSRNDMGITQIKEGNQTYVLNYDSNHQLTSITNDTNKELINLTQANNSITATRYVESHKQATYTFDLDSRGYIQAYNMALENGQKIKAHFEFENNNISSIAYTENNEATQEWFYSYDNQSNPIQGVGEKDYNTLMILEAIHNNIGSTPNFLAEISLINSHNIIQTRINDLTYNINLEYQSHLPIKGKVRNSKDEIKGSVEYTYHN